MAANQEEVKTSITSDLYVPKDISNELQQFQRTAQNMTLNKETITHIAVRAFEIISKSTDVFDQTKQQWVLDFTNRIVDDCFFLSVETRQTLHTFVNDELKKILDIVDIAASGGYAIGQFVKNTVGCKGWFQKHFCCCCSCCKPKEDELKKQAFARRII